MVNDAFKDKDNLQKKAWMLTGDAKIFVFVFFEITFLMIFFKLI